MGRRDNHGDINLTRDVFDGKTVAAPRREAAFKRTNTTKARLFQLQRHTGTRSFIWSSAVQDDFLFGRYFTSKRAELFRAHDKGARDFEGFPLYFSGVAKIDDSDRIL